MAERLRGVPMADWLLTERMLAPDEILRPQRRAVRQLDVDAGVVLREPHHFTFAIDRHLKLVDPAGQDALDVVLPLTHSTSPPARTKQRIGAESEREWSSRRSAER